MKRTSNARLVTG